MDLGPLSPASPAALKLAQSLKLFLKTSPEVRQALKELLIETELQEILPSYQEAPRGDTIEPPPLPLLQPSIPAPTAHPKGGLSFSGVRSSFDANPTDYGWELEDVNPLGQLAVYSKTFPPFGKVTMRYLFTKDIIQLIYPAVLHHPPYYEKFLKQHNKETVLEEGEEVEGFVFRLKEAIKEEKEKEGRMIVETLPGLTENLFENILHNAPRWFGEGYLSLDDVY